MTEVSFTIHCPNPDCTSKITLYSNGIDPIFKGICPVCDAEISGRKKVILDIMKWWKPARKVKKKST